MSDEPRSNKEFLGPLALPIGIIAAVLGAIGLFKSNAEVLGWKIVTGVGLLVSLSWSIWYVFAKTTKESSVAGMEPRSVPIHASKWRFATFLIPVAIIATATVAIVVNREPDYSQLFVGGGPYSPMVVFDSKPRGATVKMAWIINAEDDPLLQDTKKSDQIINPGRTLCRVRVSQGQYWAVFELNGRILTSPFTALGPTVVRADFKRSRVDELHP